MLKLDYPVQLDPADEGGYIVRFPDVPEALTQGETEAEALRHAVDALETALAFYVNEDQALPIASLPLPGQPIVRPSAQVRIKLALHAAMRAQGVRKRELARRLGWHPPQVDRLLDLNHASRLDQTEAALAALGQRLDVEIRAA